MKRIITILFLTILVAGCKQGTGSDDPKEVLTTFFKALSENDIDKMKECVTSDSQGMITMMQMSIRNMDSPQQSEQFKIGNLEFGKVTIDKDVAKVNVIEKKSKEDVTYTLKKESGKWKVAFDLGTLFEMAKEKISEEDLPDDETLSEIEDILQGKSEQFKEHLDSVTSLLKNVTEEQMESAKEILEKAKDLNPDDLKKMIEKIENQ